MENEIQKTESPLTAAAEIVKEDGSMDVSKLKALLDLQERWDATQAKKAYVRGLRRRTDLDRHVQSEHHATLAGSK